MDEEQKLRFLQAISEQAKQKDPYAQDLAIEDVRRSITNPDQLAFEDAQMKARAAQPTRPAINISQEQQAMLEQAAMQNYQKPQAEAARLQADPFERAKQPDQTNLAEMSGIMQPQNEKYRRLRKFLRK